VSRHGNGPLGGAAGGDAACPDGQFAAANHAGIVTIPPASWLAAATASIAAAEGTGVEDVVIGNDRPIGVVARDVMTFLGWL
jgi:hypothetical protein